MPCPEDTKKKNLTVPADGGQPLGVVDGVIIVGHLSSWEGRSSTLPTLFSL